MATSGKNKAKQFIFDGIDFDSGEEIMFYQWCLEAREYGYIESFSYQPPEFVLSKSSSIEFPIETKRGTKMKEQHIVRGHVYTCDFAIKPTAKFHEKLKARLKPHQNFAGWNGWYYIDIKGGFSLHGGDRSLGINRAWVWDKYKVFINKVVPKVFFKLTWCPLGCRLMKNRKVPTVKKAFVGCRTITELED